MNNQGKEIIEELDKVAKQKEEAFFTHISNRLNRPRVTAKPVQPVRGVPEFWKSYQLTSDERIEKFMTSWETLGGSAKRFATKEELAAHIAEIATSLSARSLIRANHPLFDELNLEAKMPQVESTVWRKDSPVDLLEKAAGADIGVTVVDFAIAHTGTVVVTSGPDKGRSISLLPTAFMAIIRAEDIRTRMGEVMTEINKWNGNSMPAGIHFITGPSRSSDIENDLTIGVHGPGVVFAFILG